MQADAGDRGGIRCLALPDGVRSLPVHAQGWHDFIGTLRYAHAPTPQPQYASLNDLRSVDPCGDLECDRRVSPTAPRRRARNGDARPLRPGARRVCHGGK